MSIRILRPQSRILTLPGIGLDVRGALATGAAVLISDTFTGADATLLEAHAPDVNTPGGSWDGNNLWQILSNSGRLIADASFNIATVINTGITDYRVTAVVTLWADVSSRVRGIVVRSDGSNPEDTNQFAVGLTFNGSLFQIVEGATTVRSSIAKTVVAGVPYTIEAICSGGTITATVDGGSAISYNGAATVGRSYVGARLRYHRDYVDNIVVRTL